MILGDARDTLPRWQGRADAWFLDGFSPAKNPELWSDALMAEVAAPHCAGRHFCHLYCRRPCAAGLAGGGLSGRPAAGPWHQAPHDRREGTSGSAACGPHRVMTEQNTRLGIWLMIATTFVFAVQDGISRHLAGEYNVYHGGDDPLLVLRALRDGGGGAHRPGGLRAAIRTPLSAACRSIRAACCWPPRSA